jgi:hypothetical protein
MTTMNRLDDFILAIVTVDGDKVDIFYIRQPFRREPDFAVTGANYTLATLVSKFVLPF